MTSMQWVLGIGAQKAGTTWLADYFARHPDVFSPKLKEMHFFDQLLLDDFREPVKRRFEREILEASGLEERNELAERIALTGNIEKYKTFYSSRKGKSSHVFDITPSYAMLNESHFSMIKSELKSVKCVFVMRNPTDRVWSQLKMREKLSYGEKPARDSIPTVADDPMVINRTQYVKTLNAVKNAMSSDNIFTCFYESIFESHQQGVDTLKSMSSFLELSFQEPDFSDVSNKGSQGKLSPSERYTLLQQLKPIYVDCMTAFGLENLPESWKEDLSCLGYPH